MHIRQLLLICVTYQRPLRKFYIQFYSHSERYSLRGKDELKLKKNYARTNTFKFCYFNRIVHMWNGLPLSVRQAPSVSCFKRGVRDYLTARFD